MYLWGESNPFLPWSCSRDCSRSKVSTPGRQEVWHKHHHPFPTLLVIRSQWSILQLPASSKFASAGELWQSKPSIECKAPSPLWKSCLYTCSSSRAEVFRKEPLQKNVGLRWPDPKRLSQGKTSVTVLPTPWLQYAEQLLLEEKKKRNMTLPSLGMAL